MTATARVTVTLEIIVPDSWGKSCPISQVYRQAADSAVGTINHAIRASNIKAKIIGTPEVTAVIAPEKKGGTT